MDSLCCKVVGGVAIAEAGAIAALLWALWSSRRARLRAVGECLSMVRTARRGGETP